MSTTDYSIQHNETWVKCTLMADGSDDATLEWFGEQGNVDFKDGF